MDKNVIPKLNEDPRVIEGRALLADVQLQKIEAERQIENIRRQKMESKSAPDIRAEAILACEEIHVGNEFEGTLKEIGNRLRDLQRAVQMQSERVHTIESEVSREICEKARLSYKSCIQNVAKALLLLVDAAMEEKYYRMQIRDNVSSWLLPTGAFTPVGGGDLLRNDASVAYWFREQIENGYLSRDDVPKKYQEAWAFDYLLHV